MNVAFDSWIPVVTKEGTLAEVSLCDVFAKGHLYADLSVFAHERVALMRLFLAVAHAALDGPKNREEWEGAEQKLPASVTTYLEKWRDHFEMSDPKKPWLQFAKLKPKQDKAEGDEAWIEPKKLAFYLASGNASTHFDHAGRLTPSAIIRSMLAYQCFSPGGLMGQVCLQGVESKKSTCDSPCCPSSMLHAFVRADTLRATIAVNLPTYEMVRAHYGDKLGRPVWEDMPNSFDDASAIENATRTYLGRLVPIKRLMLFSQKMEGLLLGDGFDYPGFFDGFPAEPTATVIAGKEARKLLAYRPSRALWRELGSLIVRRDATGVGGPLCLSMAGDNTGLDLIVSAFARDQASIVDVAEAVFHVSPAIQTPMGVETYTAEALYAEAVFSRLSWVVEVYRQEIDSGWEGRLKLAGPKKNDLRAKLAACAANHYWTQIEAQLPVLFHLVDCLGTDDFVTAQQAWRALLLKTAQDAYIAACGQDTPRQMKAFAKGWRALKKTITVKSETTETNSTDEGDDE